MQEPTMAFTVANAKRANHYIVHYISTVYANFMSTGSATTKTTSFGTMKLTLNPLTRIEAHLSFVWIWF